MPALLSACKRNRNYTSEFSHFNSEKPLVPSGKEQRTFWFLSLCFVWQGCLLCPILSPALVCLVPLCPVYTVAAVKTVLPAGLSRSISHYVTQIQTRALRTVLSHLGTGFWMFWHLCSLIHKYMVKAWLHSVPVSGRTFTPTNSDLYNLLQNT